MFGKLSVIISLNRLSVLFSLSFPSGTWIITNYFFCWYLTDQAFFTLFHSFLLCSPLTGISSSIFYHRFFFQFGPFCHECSLLHLSFHSPNSSAPEFASDSFFFLMISMSLLIFSFCTLLSWFCWIIFLYFLIAYWVSLK